MANGAQLLAKLGLDTRDFDRGMEKAVRDSKRGGLQLSDNFKVAAGAAAALTAGIVATTKALGTMAQRGSQINAVQRAFRRRVIDSDGAMRDLRSATLGLVDDFDLMTQANQALTLGSARSAEEVAELASVATRLGRALGLDVQFALNSLNTGIARQSRLLLDNVGVIVDVEEANRKYAAAIGTTVAALTDAQKQEAFRTEALGQASAAADQLGDELRDAGTAWGEFLTEVKNSASDLQTGVTQSSALESVFKNLAMQLRIVRFRWALLREEAAKPFPMGPPLGSSPSQPFGIEGITVTAPAIQRVPDRGRVAGRQRFGTIPRDLTQSELLGLPELTAPALPTGAESARAAMASFEPIDISRDLVAIAKANEETRKWREAIIGVSAVIENTLVRSLTRAIMRFESISSLIKDIGKSLLSSVIGGLVSFGVKALSTAALTAIGVPVPLASEGAVFPSMGGSGSMSFTISSDVIPEPTDYGVIASKPQVQRLLVQALRNARANGAGV